MTKDKKMFIAAQISFLVIAALLAGWKIFLAMFFVNWANNIGTMMKKMQ